MGVKINSIMIDELTPLKNNWQKLNEILFYWKNSFVNENLLEDDDEL